MPEMEIMIEEMQEENKRLGELLKRSKKEGLSGENNKYECDKNKRENKRIIERLNIYENITKEQKEKLEIKQKQIEYLENIIINKDNIEHDIRKKIRIIEKEKEELMKICEELHEKTFEIRKKQENEVCSFKNSINNQIEIVKKNWKKIVLEKDKKIKELQDSTKASEGVVKKGRESPHEMENLISMGRKASLDFGSVRLLIPEQKMDSSVTKRHKSNTNEPNIFINSTIFGNEESNRFLFSPKDNNNEPNQQLKSRKIEYNQIKQIGDLIKYRMIIQKISCTQIKEYFTYPEETNEEEDNSLTWEKEYISQKELEKILVSIPFNLTFEQSILLGRYLIEDDEQIMNENENENRRDIVKSIIKALLGEYEVYVEKEEQEIKEFYHLHATHLNSALETYYPNGFVSQSKLLDILCAIGAEPTEKQFDYLISRASLESSSLEELNYNKIFDKL